METEIKRVPKHNHLEAYCIMTYFCKKCDVIEQIIPIKTYRFA